MAAGPSLSQNAVAGGMAGAGLGVRVLWACCPVLFNQHPSQNQNGLCPTWSTRSVRSAQPRQHQVCEAGVLFQSIEWSQDLDQAPCVCHSPRVPRTLCPTRCPAGVIFCLVPTWAPPSRGLSEGCPHRSTSSVLGIRDLHGDPVAGCPQHVHSAEGTLPFPGDFGASGPWHGQPWVPEDAREPLQVLEEAAFGRICARHSLCSTLFAGRALPSLSCPVAASRWTPEGI